MLSFSQLSSCVHDVPHGRWAESRNGVGAGPQDGGWNGNGGMGEPVWASARGEAEVTLFDSALEIYRRKQWI